MEEREVSYPNGSISPSYPKIFTDDLTSHSHRKQPQLAVIVANRSSSLYSLESIHILAAVQKVLLTTARLTAVRCAKPAHLVLHNTVFSAVYPLSNMT